MTKDDKKNTLPKKNNSNNNNAKNNNNNNSNNNNNKSGSSNSKKGTVLPTEDNVTNSNNDRQKDSDRENPNITDKIQVITGATINNNKSNLQQREETAPTEHSLVILRDRTVNNVDEWDLRKKVKSICKVMLSTFRGSRPIV